VRLARRAIDAATHVLGWLRRGRRIDVSGEARPLRVNLGCGLAVAPGWINVDGSLNALIASMPRPVHGLAYRFTGAATYYQREDYLALLGNHKFVHHDLGYSLPFGDATVDYVYSSHFLEHLPRKAALNLVAESHRVLRPGGVMRVVVPDLEYAVSLYPRSREEMLRQYFFVEDDDSHYARHKYMYDYASLAAVLGEAGFQGIQRLAYREGRTPNLDRLDNRPEDSLYVEAAK
jgi:predicted SAM-dependent methyltransferase